MAERAKYRYRGRTYTRASLKPGKKRVHVKSHCRSKRSVPEWIQSKAKDWGF